MRKLKMKQQIQQVEAQEVQTSCSVDTAECSFKRRRVTSFWPPV